MITNKLTIGYIIRKWLILLGVAVLAFFSFSSVLAQESSPSGTVPDQERPFIDDNGDGIDDIEQRLGQYADPQIRAKIYGVEFPIVDLGDCGSYFECRSFCEDPVNGETCINYGKSRGFYKDDPVVLEKDKILGEAKKRLGCDSYEACLNFCEIPANYDTCNSFAKSQGIAAGVVNDPGREEIITKAKEVLGCDSANSCQAFCLQQDNISKCKSFAEEVGLKGGEYRVGPGGCQSEGTCKTFCSDPNNFQVCQGFTEVSGGTFSGPGGCNSAESCLTYCQQNPTDCGYREGEDPGKGIAPGGGFYNPLEMCNRTPNCSWAGNSCSCGYYGETKETVQKAQEYVAYCSANPAQCPQGRPPEIFGNSEKRQEFEDFCKTNPDKCRPPAEQASEVSYGRYGGYYYSSAGPDPAAECDRYGCSWNGSSCQCSAANVRSYTPPAFTEQNPESSAPPPGPGSYLPPGGSYTPPSSGTYTQPYSGSYTTPSSGSYTPPSSGSYTPPSTESYTPPSSGSYTPPSGDSGGSVPPPPSGDSGGSTPPPPSGDSGGSVPPPSGVQGVATVGGLLQALLNFLQGR